MTKLHTIGMLVYDEPGVMTRITGLFARRGFNIETITVGKTNIPRISKIIITVKGDDSVLEQIQKQINKLIDVVKASDLPPDESVIRELCLVKVAISNDKAKDEILKYCDIYKTRILDITPKSAIVQIVGDSNKIDSFIDLLKKFGIKEISRTGVTAMARGHKIIGDRK